MNFKMLSKSYARREAWWKYHSKAGSISLKGTLNISHPKPAHSLLQPVLVEKMLCARCWGYNSEHEKNPPSLHVSCPILRETKLSTEFEDLLKFLWYQQSSGILHNALNFLTLICYQNSVYRLFLLESQGKDPWRSFGPVSSRVHCSFILHKA